MTVTMTQMTEGGDDQPVLIVNQNNGETKLILINENKILSKKLNLILLNQFKRERKSWRGKPNPIDDSDSIEADQISPVIQ